MARFTLRALVPPAPLIISQFAITNLCCVFLLGPPSRGIFVTYFALGLAWITIPTTGSYFVRRLRQKGFSHVPNKGLGTPTQYLVTSLLAVTSNIVIGYAAAYRNLSLCEPASFSESLSVVDAVYFSMTTLTTVGYGDIVARSQQARLVVSTELLATLVFIFLIVGLFVTILAQLEDDEQCSP